MKLQRVPLYFALLLASVLPASAADRLEQWYSLMPKDTVGVIAIKNTQELLTDWDQSTFSKFMQDEAVQRWTAPMRKDGDAPWDKYFKDHYGTGMYDTLKEYPGALVSFFVLDDFESFDKKHAPNVSLCELGGKQAEIEAHKASEVQAEKKTNEDIEMRTEEIGGVQVSVAADGKGADAPWFTAWAVVGDVMIESNSRPHMEYMVNALKSGAGDAPGAGREHLTRIGQHTQGGGDVMIYLNGVRLLELADKAIAESEAKKKPEEKIAGGMITPQQIMGMFGVQELQAMAFTFELQGNQVRGDVVILHPEKPTGFVSLMRTSSNELELPSYMPADVLQGAVVRYDMTKFYDSLLGMIMKMGPMAMMVTMQIPSFEQQLGFKIRDDFLASLDDELATVQNGELLEQSQVIIFKLKDADKIGGALESLKRYIGAGFGAFEESEYLGHKVNTLKISQTSTAASEVAYVNTGKYLLVSVGGQDTMNKVLARMKDPSGPSLWDGPETQKLLASVPQGYGSASITDVGSMINMLASAANALDSGAKKKGPGKNKGPGKKADADADAEETPAADSKSATKDTVLDSKAVPSKEVFQRYFGRMLGTQYSLPDAVQSHYLIIAPEVQ